MLLFEASVQADPSHAEVGDILSPKTYQITSVCVLGILKISVAEDIGMLRVVRLVI